MNIHQDIYLKGTYEAGERNVRKIKEGKIQDHKILGNAREHFGELEHVEKARYLEFIKCRTAFQIMDMKGESFYEGY